MTSEKQVRVRGGRGRERETPKRYARGVIREGQGEGGNKKVNRVSASPMWLPWRHCVMYTYFGKLLAKIKHFQRQGRLGSKNSQCAPPYLSHTEIAIPPPSPSHTGIAIILPPSLLGTSPPSHLRQTLSPKFPALPHNHCLFLHISLPPSLFYLENSHTLSLSHIDQTFPLLKPRTPSQSPYLSVCMSSGRKVIFSFPLFKIIPSLTRFTLPALPRNFSRKGKTSYLFLSYTYNSL